MLRVAYVLALAGIVGSAWFVDWRLGVAATGASVLWLCYAPEPKARDEGKP